MLLGATGTGKSATTAWLIEKVQRPTLVMAPNKTLAAQLANELRELFPHNAVEYFVSYYDYYQPEALFPDGHLHREGLVDQLRRGAAPALGHHVAAVPAGRDRGGVGVLHLRPRYPAVLPGPVAAGRGRRHHRPRHPAARAGRHPVRPQRCRVHPRSFRVRGDTVEIIPSYEELAIRIEFFGDEIERLYYLHPLTGDVVRDVPSLRIFPATHYVAGPERMAKAIAAIEQELADRLAELERQGKLLEAQRLRMRTSYDVEMMRQVGFCSGMRTTPGTSTVRPPGRRRDPDRLFPGGLPARHRRITRHRSADRRDARGRRVPQTHPRRPRVPAAVGIWTTGR